jgi:hypothetical protein
MPKTNFRPDTHGFAFVNRWTLDYQEINSTRRQLRDGIGAIRTPIQSVLVALRVAPGLRRALEETSAEMIGWVDNAAVEPYGLCGGMAFAALDYYLAGRDVPRGASKGHPTDQTPEGKRLRDYLTKRLADSLALNVGTFLVWMAILQDTSGNGPFAGGAGRLRRESEKQWRKLKRIINRGQPIPLGLVGTTEDPTQNHQVLAYGYDDPGDGTGTIWVYDMNCPGKERAIEVDFRGEVLKAEEDCPSSMRGSLRGFFCEEYVREFNPPRVDWS